MQSLPLTYGIEKDEEGNEALYMNATVRNNIVELDWVREEDNAETYAQRAFTRFEAIANTNSSLPPQSACLMMRLYRRGDVLISSMACADGYGEQAIRLAKEAALGIYDEVYPDIAVEAQAFVQESIENVMRLGAVDVLPLLEAGAGGTIRGGTIPTSSPRCVQSDLGRTGEVAQRIGWLVNNVMALVPFTPSFEKYRCFRAVAEVARRVNAEAVVCVSDGYKLGSAGERTGEEILVVSWINPDATCVSVAAAYKRRKHSQVDHDIIIFLSKDATEPADSKCKQNIIPAWGIYQPN